MDLAFLAQADNVTFKLELAKTALEAARQAHDLAKQAYDELLAQADGHGIPRAKLKKLTEDRVLALMESGLLAARTETKPSLTENKRERIRKTTIKTEAAENDTQEHTESTKIIPTAELRM